MIMKKLLTGCMVALAILVALTGLAGCDQDKVLYNGRNYLMFSDTLYHYAVQESNEKLEVPVSATRRADYDRTFAVEVVDKESNAGEGKHYRLLSNTVTIKAGEHLYGEYDPAPDYFRNRGRRRKHDCAARTVLRRIRHQAEIQQRGYT